MQEDFTKASQILKEGGIVIFPTDTAFAISCRIDNEKAVERLFTIRNRPAEKATPVLVSSIEMAKEYIKEIPNNVEEKLLKPFWPGGLTVVLSCKVEKIPSLVRGGGETLGVRMPNHQTALTLINEVGVPLLGPSANFAGGQTPFSFDDLDPELIKLVDFVVEGVCTVKKASTVVDCTSTPWKILREGSVIISL